MDDMFKRIEVWRPTAIGKGSLIYVCFQNLQTKKYYVQAVNFILDDIKHQTINYQAMIGIEQFFENDKNDTEQILKYSDTLEEAIKNYIKL